MLSLLELCVTLALVTVISTLFYYKHRYDYWRRKGIATIQPKIPFGNFSNPFFGKDGLSSTFQKHYEEFRLRDVKFGGLYAGAKPVLMAVHPDVIKDVMISNFQNFASHGITVDVEREPLLGHLFTMEGQKWKDMRVKLTPTFTSGKMKMMFQTLLTCGKQLEEFLDNCCSSGNVLDIKEISACYTTDVIGSCAFGVDCNSFKNPDAEFRRFGRKLTTPRVRVTLRRFADMISPYLVKLFKLKFMDSDLHQFFLNIVRDMVRYRQTKEITRNDFMQLLINIEKQAGLEGKQAFTLEEMAAQAFVFFLAGFETSSTTMTFCLYELAHHQDIQDKLREEINTMLAKHEGNITYEAVMEVKYLDQVINETLRKYPPVSVLQRVCTQPCQLFSGATVEKGTHVFISSLGLHRDQEHFPNPDNFMPDRFSDENKHNIRPYTFLPFGEGPRICIGSRFGLMQTKVGLCLMLKNRKLLPGKDLSYPVEFHANSLVLTSKGTILLRAETVI